MNRAERRALRKSRKGSHGYDCGCPHLGNLVGVLVCSCGAEHPVDVWMPTSGNVGDYREVGTWCRACDDEVVGQALIVDVEV